jgi:hypothetical protein
MTLVINIRGGQDRVAVDKAPDNCPICHLAIVPIDLAVAIQCNLNGFPCVERILQCPNEKCQHLFIAQYIRIQKAHFELRSCVPLELISSPQSKTISAISPDFYNIYEQADKAERRGLVLVAGPGYRKALEFLIKDYIISQFTEEDADKKAAHIAAVEKQPLGPCIQQYVMDGRIMEISKRAVWLGNDETHYVRKWEGKDLEDLKRLISITLHWVEMEKHTAEIIKDMPERKA